MLIGKVVGTVVSVQKDEKLRGFKLQIIQPVDIKTREVQGKPLVAADTVGAGYGELVLVVSGSSARQTDRTRDLPVDSAVVGIVNEMEVDGSTVYRA